MVTTKAAITCIIKIHSRYFIQLKTFHCQTIDPEQRMGPAGRILSKGYNPDKPSYSPLNSPHPGYAREMDSASNCAIFIFLGNFIFVQ